MSLHVGCLAPTHLHLHPSVHTEERVSSICMRFAPVTLHIIRSPLPQIPPQYVTIYSQRGHRRSRGFSYRSSSAPVAMMNSFPTEPHTQTHTHQGQHVYVGWLMRKPKANKMTKVEPYLKTPQKTTVNEMESCCDICFKLQKSGIDSAVSACLSEPWETWAPDSELSRLGSGRTWRQTMRRLCGEFSGKHQVWSNVSTSAGANPGRFS